MSCGFESLTRSDYALDDGNPRRAQRSRQYMTPMILSGTVKNLVLLFTLMVQADAVLREGFDVVLDANLGYTKCEHGAGIFAGSRSLVYAWLSEKPAKC